MTWKDGVLTTDSSPTEGSNGKATFVERTILGEELIMVSRCHTEVKVRLKPRSRTNDRSLIYVKV